jgi:hypothetical protein
LTRDGGGSVLGRRAGGGAWRGRPAAVVGEQEAKVPAPAVRVSPAAALGPWPAAARVSVLSDTMLEMD